MRHRGRSDPRRTPLTPIFRRPKETGSVLVGNTPGTPPVVCPITGTETDVSMTDVQPIAVSGNYAYVGSFFDEYVTVIDISDPAAPTTAGSITAATLSGVNDLAVSGTHVFAACESGNIVAIDVSTPASPSISQAFGTGITSLDGIAIAGSVAYVCDFGGDSVHSIDISNPASMSILDTVTDATFLNGAYGIAVSGNTAIVGSVQGTNYVSSIDITNPSSMSLLDSITDGSMTDPYRVAIVGSNAYVADYQAGGGRIYSIDFSTPGTLAIDDIHTDALFNGIIWISADASNSKVYVSGSWSDRFVAIDVTDPTNLATDGSVQDPSHGLYWGLTNSGSYVYGLDYGNSTFFVIHKDCFA